MEAGYSLLSLYYVLSVPIIKNRFSGFKHVVCALNFCKL